MGRCHLARSSGKISAYSIHISINLGECSVGASLRVARGMGAVTFSGRESSETMSCSDLASLVGRSCYK